MESNTEAQKDQILEILKKEGEIDSQVLADKMKLNHQQAIGLIKALETKEIVVSEKKEAKRIVLTNDGKDCLEKVPQIFKF